MSVTADALNSALLHSLWQDAIVGLLLWGTLIAMRRASAHARYIVCSSRRSSCPSAGTALNH